MLTLTLQCETCDNLLTFRPGVDPRPECCGKECRNHTYTRPPEVKNEVDRQARAKAERQAKAKAAILAGDKARLDDLTQEKEEAARREEEKARKNMKEAQLRAEGARRKAVEAQAKAQREEAEARARAKREEAKARAIQREPIVRASNDIATAIGSGDGGAVIAAIHANTITTTYGCWELTHNLEPYPTVSGRGLHRISLEAKEGAPLGVQAAHHKCANNRCVNPDHLQPVTERENTAEMFARKSYIDRIAELEEALEAISPGHELLNRIPTSARIS